MLKRGIFSKIFVLILTTYLILLIFISIFFTKERFDDLKELYTREKILVAKTLAKTIESSFFEQILPFNILKEVSDAEDISFLWIVKPDGEVYYADDPEMFGKKIVDPDIGREKMVVKNILFKNKEKVQLIIFPVKLEVGERSWSLILGTSLKKFALVEKKVIFFTFIFLLATLLITIFISFYLTKQITDPLDTLKDGVEMIAKGDLNYRIKIKTGDEIEKLANAFNEMTEKLAKFRSRLEESKDILEIRVRARTRQLRELAESLDQQVKEKTKALNQRVKELEDSRRALLNILEDEKKAKEIAEEERRKTLLIIQNFADGLLIFDLKEKCILVNPQAENLLEIKAKEILGKSVSDLKLIPNLQPLLKYFEGGLKKFFRQEVLLKEDKILEVTSLPITREEKPPLGYLIVLHDITREKMIEKMKTEFVSVAAHQLRTPLSAIKWTLKEVLDGDFGEILPEQKEILEKTYKSNERLINLVNDLLNVARIEEGRYVFKPVPQNLEKIVEKVLNSFKEEFEKKGVLLEFEREREIFPQVTVDEEKIELAIENLVDNALRYTPPGGKVKVSLKLFDKEIEFSIKDTGIGIPKNDQQKVFTKFFRAQNALKMETEGSGLGLFIVKNIIEAHNGKIWFESEEGKGTTFYFRLPIKE